ncbi:MAG: amine oxidase [Verrucomicrobiaceae bacterium]|nr:amine oxidase [Verrucomicrobiaceae bacterium]
MTSPHIAVIGAGLSGSACAQLLERAGFRVTVFEKSRGSGGRLASKRIGAHTVNLGAQSLRASSAEFREQLNDWARAGLLEVRDGEGWPLASTSKLTRALLHNVELQNEESQSVKLQNVELMTSTHVETIQYAAQKIALFDSTQRPLGEFSAVVVSAPPAQAEQLLRVDPVLSAQCAAASVQPAWVAVFIAPHAWPPATVLPESIARVVSRSIDGAHYWSVEASSAWSEREIEREPQWIAAQLKAALGFNEIDVLHCHRWRYARVAKPLGKPFLLRNALGVCGDWLQGNDAEAAWHSGRELARALIAG